MDTTATNWTTPWPRFDPGENPIRIPALELLEYANLPMFDMRNGDPSDARSLLIKPTISPAYHWVPLSGSDPEHAVRDVEGYIKGQIEQLEEHPPVGLDQAQRRKVGICLGVSRAVATGLFSLGVTDLIPGETSIPKMMVEEDANHERTYVVNPSLDDAAKDRLRAPLTLSETEQAVVGTLLMSSIGTVALQGYSLMMTQHHYLSGDANQSRKAYAVVEKQFWRGTDVSAWFTADITVIQDAMWHKACHPVNMAIKLFAATSPQVAGMIREAGAGSAASRLPAVEAEVRAANSYRTLMATVQPMYRMCGGSVVYEMLDMAMEVVKAFPVGVANPQRPTGLDPRVPATVVDRPTARLWLSSLLSRNADKAAHCYGFYCALTDSSMMTGTGSSTGAESLRASYSLSKLQSQSHAAFISGQQFYSDYQSVRAALRAQGSVTAPLLEVD